MRRRREGVSVADLGFYAVIARLPGLERSFRAKILLVAFLGTHVPLLALLVYYVASGTGDQTETIRVMIIALLATVVGTGLIIAAITALLRPIDAIHSMLDRYRRERVVPRLPLVSGDELGRLARSTAETLAELDTYFVESSRRDAATGALNAEGFKAALCERLQCGAKPELAILELPEFSHWTVVLDQEAAGFIAAITIERMRLELPEQAIIGTLGQGRFAVALQGGPAWIEQRFETLLYAASEPIRVRGREVNNLPRMGTAGPEYASEAARLMSAAESALIAAREHTGAIRVMATGAGEAIRSRLELTFELEQGLREQQFYPVYQKRLDAASGRVVAVEALLRWRHPTRGDISPTLFIPLAEHTGRIGSLGEQVLDLAVAQAALWNQQGHTVRVSVNVSAYQLTNGHFPSIVEATLARHSLDPRLLELELTEGALLADFRAAARQLEGLRAIGIRIALDDFGSGYSSLNYLGRLPLDTLKIDKTFVDRVHEPRYRSVVAGIVQLAAGLDLRTTAEGVETRAQARTLRELGCDEWQGFLDAKPVPPQEIDLSMAADGTQ